MYLLGHGRYRNAFFSGNIPYREGGKRGGHLGTSGVRSVFLTCNFLRLRCSSGCWKEGKGKKEKWRDNEKKKGERRRSVEVEREGKGGKLMGEREKIGGRRKVEW